MNRKLIRTTLAEIKEREQQQAARQVQQAQAQQQPSSSTSSSAQPRKRIPPEQTNAETFYYKKQMDARTPMVVVLQDGEELHGVIEWYDKNCIKLHRQDAPNLLILKHNIKYLYKDTEGKDEE